MVKIKRKVLSRFPFFKDLKKMPNGGDQIRQYQVVRRMRKLECLIGGLGFG